MVNRLVASFILSLAHMTYGDDARGGVIIPLTPGTDRGHNELSYKFRINFNFRSSSIYTVPPKHSSKMH